MKNTINFKIIETKNLPQAEVEIHAEIKAESLEQFRKKVLNKIQKDLVLPGFRPGHVPENILIKQVGDLFIYTEMAEMAINEIFAEIISSAKINFITLPNVQLNKIAVGNPVEFKIVGPVMPEIKLANYEKIAKAEMKKEDEPVEATDKELDETVDEIRKNYALRNHEHPSTELGAGKEGEEHSHDNLPLPELNDEFVKKLGAFKDVADFKEKIKDGIKKEKEFKNRDKKRLAIIEKLIDESKIDLPKVLVDSEIRKMQAQFEDDLVRAGLKMDDYLKHLKKSKDDLVKEWTPDAERRAKVQLIVSKIAIEEKLEADQEQVKKEVEALMKTYPGATEDRTKAYVEMMLIYEKVFAWLESQK